MTDSHVNGRSLALHYVVIAGLVHKPIVFRGSLIESHWLPAPLRSRLFSCHRYFKPYPLELHVNVRTFELGHFSFLRVKEASVMNIWLWSVGLWKLELQSFPVWLSDGAEHCESSGLAFPWFNTVQPLAICHPLYLVDSCSEIWHSHLLQKKPCKFSSPSTADPFLLNSCCQTQVWGYLKTLLVSGIVSTHFIDFKKNYQLLVFVVTSYFEDRNWTLLFVLLRCQQLSLKCRPNSPSMYHIIIAQ